MTEDTLDGDPNAPPAEVLATAGDLLDRGREAVLVTVVDVDGNAYRRPGAVALVAGDEEVGSVGAGCLSARVHEVAAAVRERGAPRVERIDPAGDEDAWGLGLGCDGVVTLLFEPLAPALRPLLDAVAAGEGAVAVAPLDGEGRGTRALFDHDGTARTVGDAFPDEFVDAAGEAAARHAADGVSGTAALGDGRAFVHVLAPRPELLIVGSGPDVAPLAALASDQGFRVTVAGFRGGVDLAERAPAADRRVTTAPAELVDAVEADERTYAVVMTHNLVDDHLVLDALLDTPVPYVGLMGPGERFDDLLETFRDGEGLAPAERERVYTPVGLDLGASDPRGVALSVVAEVTAVRNDREPGHLRRRGEPIHPRPE
jgi:xanthine dehydrogenase accessory factor